MRIGSRPTLLKLAALALCLLVIGGCASRDDRVLPEQEYYELARSALENRNFSTATRNLEFLETYYPFGRYAEQAQLDLIYARFQSQDLDGARSSADRFLRLNPQSANADYALYVRGVASYYMDLGLAVRYFPVAADARDPGEQRRSYQDFFTLVNQFPDSPYAADSRQRMIAIRNRLAGLELHAARYYVKRQAYLAAANRAQGVVEDFPRTPAVEEALVIQTEMFRRLGLRQEANETQQLLALNFPENPALDSDGEFIRQNFGIQDRSLRNVLTFGLLGRPAELDD
ncbi:MAG: outer membrane protein assembly factor BamD [Halomonadaceae bacterium]|nr:MAG: outer membrane protein assembly factor BamD [Halomonadaceae bacterium]